MIEKLWWTRIGVKTLENNSKLAQRTRELLTLALASGGTIRTIADGTGLGRAWIWAFAQGDIVGPSVNRIETLYNYLSDKPLVVN